MAEFQPSSASRTPAEEVRATIRYLRKAADKLQDYVDQEGAIPPWVYDKLRQAAMCAGMAVSFTANASEKAAEPPKPLRRARRRRRE